jgi:chromosome segregation ATPase
MLQDRIAAATSRSDSSASFWAQLGTLVDRHESQMQALSERATALRTELTAARKSSSSAHVKRMDDARSELEALQAQLRQASAELQSGKRESLRVEEQNLRSQLSLVNAEIEERTDSIRVLQKSSSRMKDRTQSQRSEYEAKAKALNERSRDAEARMKRLAADIDAANREIQDIDEQLEELEHREMACIGLYDSLKQPLPVIQRIFAAGDLS